MSIRSITPRTSCSAPIGISVATTCSPKAAFSESSVAKKSARSRSSMLTKTSRASPSSSARCQSRSVLTSTPPTALTTTTQESAARSAAAASATKLGSPGVSIRLISRSSCSKQETQALIERPAPALVGLVVGDRRPVLDAAQPVDRPRLEQHRLVQARLPAPPVPDQGDVADPIRRLVRHGTTLHPRRGPRHPFRRSTTAPAWSMPGSAGEAWGGGAGESRGAASLSAVSR